MTIQVEQVKFTGNAVAVDGVVTALSGNAMEDMWDKSRGRPLRRSLALWLFSMKATWKIIRAHKSEAKQIKAAAWVRQQVQSAPLALSQLVVLRLVVRGGVHAQRERPAHRAPRHSLGCLSYLPPKTPMSLPLAIQVRDELLRLGPTMIKLGQVASARTDLLSQPYIDALVALQDSVHRTHRMAVTLETEDELAVYAAHK